MGERTRAVGPPRASRGLCSSNYQCHYFMYHIHVHTFICIYTYNIRTRLDHQYEWKQEVEKQVSFLCLSTGRQTHHRNLNEDKNSYLLAIKTCPTYTVINRWPELSLSYHNPAIRLATTDTASIGNWWIKTISQLICSYLNGSRFGKIRCANIKDLT